MENSHSSKTGTPVRTYAYVFAGLAVITLIELLLSGFDVGLAGGTRNALFIIFSLGKAMLVASFYMHLKGDNRFYRYIFLLPVLLFLAFALLMIIR